MTKVIVVGLQKTGLTSMSKALTRLGFKEKKIARDITARGGFYSTGELELEDGEFLCDFAPQEFRWLHKLHPDAKFILTCRDVIDWLKSLKNYWETHPRAEPQHSALWVAHMGLCGFNEEYHREYYLRHTMQVIDYFARDELFIHYTHRDDYGPLCEYLGWPIIDEPWPHENKGTYERP